jgi:hypothetical protein
MKVAMLGPLQVTIRLTVSATGRQKAGGIVGINGFLIVS